MRVSLRYPQLLPSIRHASSSPIPDFPLPEIHLGLTHRNRYHQHYDSTLSTDLMYMSYDPRISHRPLSSPPTLEPQTPYELNRPTPPLRGNRPARPSTKPITPETIPKLESIVLHTMVKEAIGRKQNLLSAIQALRVISGESPNGGGRPGSSGVQIVNSRIGASAFNKLRAGMPIAAKVEIKGEAMYDFIQSLVDFVLPRIRDWPGVPLPPSSANKMSPSALAGIVSFGLPANAMGLFPQIESNIDSYPRLHGFHMYFKTNARGERAQEQARALLSGFRIPFYRK
ncbi:hypothetical protein TREMEDRAFT_34906 [Tremella mesenterica DSM 1558]|uniref:uncharacterized protein n=1 Tax=Tremella mesenterica (strain ATCC 24925 / CBS 8224 / DSM 1558 / NBRC 9311 / NRRL Y-6157 / RJB 2259-6 / UBC 559-6) TaxID=578456 RepID=UPI00032CDA3C|nr:uncharacterized protein TREMEDRAFT_34906 [Tremella mesenterica DSM 1558]EIW66612.1 hypothetical protein TREMEDRAFT_34906 [Tremella mesenterica DSM 1558]